MDRTRRHVLALVPVGVAAPLTGCGVRGADPPPGALRVVDRDDADHGVTATVADREVAATLSVPAGEHATSEQFVADPGGRTVRIAVDGDAVGTVEVVSGGSIEASIDSDGGVTLGSAVYD